MKKLLISWDPHANSLSNLLRYQRTWWFLMVYCLACLTKQGEVGSSPTRANIPIFSNEFVERKKSLQFAYIQFNQ